MCECKKIRSMKELAEKIFNYDGNDYMKNARIKEAIKKFKIKNVEFGDVDSDGTLVYLYRRGTKPFEILLS